MTKKVSLSNTTCAVRRKGMGLSKPSGVFAISFSFKNWRKNPLAVNQLIMSTISRRQEWFLVRLTVPLDRADSRKKVIWMTKVIQKSSLTKLFLLKVRKVIKRTRNVHVDLFWGCLVDIKIHIFHLSNQIFLLSYWLWLKVLYLQKLSILSVIKIKYDKNWFHISLTATP